MHRRLALRAKPAQYFRLPLRFALRRAVNPANNNELVRSKIKLITGMIKSNSISYAAFQAILFFLIGLLLSPGVIALTPTPEQIEQFRRLPPSQQEAIAKQYGIDPAIISGAVPVMAPVVPTESVAPRAPAGETVAAPEEKAIEETASEANDKTTLAEPKEEKVLPRKLEQFGYDLFAGSPSTFAPVTDIPVSMDYVMGPGDTVQVQFYGKENVTHQLVVNREGQINFPGIGPLSVAGMNFAEMKDFLLDTVARRTIGINASITLGELRSIRVFVLGDAFRPGSYTVSSLSTITNALFVSGGITKIGSLRNVQLKRNGEIIATLDLYDLLLKGDTRNDKRLLPGDVIFIPPIGITAGIGGEVKRPAIYELKEEKAAADLVKLAGGYHATAYPQASRIERIDPQGNRTLIDVDLTKPASMEIPIRNGDVLQVFSVLEKMENVVLLEGHVQRPGGFAWKKGMRVSSIVGGYADLLPDPDPNYGLIVRERMPDRRIQVLAFAPRYSIGKPSTDHDPLLNARDKVLLFGRDQSRAGPLSSILSHLNSQVSYNEPPLVVQVTGSVQFAGEYPLVNGMTVKHLVDAAGGFTLDVDRQYALIVNKQFNDGRINIQHQRLSDEQSLARKLLPGDRLITFSVEPDKPRDGLLASTLEQLKLQADFNEMPQIVTASGNLRFPGQYPFTDAMTVNDLIMASGGLQQETDMAYALLVHRLHNQSRIKLDMVRLGEAESNHKNLLPGDQLITFALNTPRLSLLEPIISQLSQQTSDKESLKLASVGGSVRFPGLYPLTTEMTVGDLLKAAGGFTEKAFNQHAEVTRALIGANREQEYERLELDLSEVTALQTRLQSRDQLFVKSIPNWKDNESVTLSGEVRFPGVYPVYQGDDLHSVLQRAGGLTDYAYVPGAIFTREELRVQEEKRLQELRDRLAGDILKAELSIGQESAMVGEEKQASSMQEVVQAKALLEQLDATKAVGRMVVDLQQVLDAKPGYHVDLRNGDELYVPQRNNAVTIIGEVQHPTSQHYVEGASHKDYLEKSGGTTERADNDRIYIVRADGSIALPSNGFLFLPGVGESINPGDTIVVPLSTDRVNQRILWRDASQIFYQIALGAAAVASF